MPGTDAPWREIYRAVRDANTVKAHVGVLAAKGGNVTHVDSGMTLVEIATTHEFGSSDGHVPERSWLRSTFHVRKRDELAQKIEAAARLVLDRRLDARRAVNLLGAWGAAECKNTITQNEADSYGPFPYPPLADSTIAAKGSSVPLVDTGQFVGSISWEVVDMKAAT